MSGHADQSSELNLDNGTEQHHLLYRRTMLPVPGRGLVAHYVAPIVRQRYRPGCCGHAALHGFFETEPERRIFDEVGQPASAVICGSTVVTGTRRSADHDALVNPRKPDFGCSPSARLRAPGNDVDSTVAAKRLAEFSRKIFFLDSICYHLDLHT